MTTPEGAEGLIGSHYRAPDYFEVGREKIREFAISVQDDNPTHFSEVDAAEAGYPTLVAPLTFLAIAGRRVQPGFCTGTKSSSSIARCWPTTSCTSTLI
jgi:hypothetical protein